MVGQSEESPELPTNTFVDSGVEANSSGISSPRVWEQDSCRDSLCLWLWHTLWQIVSAAVNLSLNVEIDDPWMTGGGGSGKGEFNARLPIHVRM